MQTETTTQEITATHVTPPLPLSKARKRIIKLAERQQKLDAARAKALKEVADEERSDIIASGKSEFLAALAALDSTTREMVVSNVLQATENQLRRDKILAWIAMISEEETGKNGIGEEGKIRDDDEKSTNAEGKTEGSTTNSALNANSDLPT